MPSDVQVFVRFKEQCVFAGEDLNCIITFKNVAEHTEPPPTPGAGIRHTKRCSINQLAAAQAAAAVSARLAPPGRHQNARAPSVGHEERPRPQHQSSFSVSTPATPPDTSPSTEQGGFRQKTHHQHQRSVSIVSMTSPVLPPTPSTANSVSGRPTLGHKRSSTMTLADAARKVGHNDRQLSSDFRNNRIGGRRSPLSASHSPSDAERESAPDFKFPAERSSVQPERVHAAPPSAMPRIAHRRDASIASRATDPRASMDFYSQSNHSGETLMSEQMSLASERPTARSRMPSELIRQHYKMGPPPPPRKPQATTLLMGYAQVSATFTLDASLVDQTPFEEVKKKGFLGGQSGGGVVGVKKKARPSSGLWGGFNFASIGESLESIMGGESSGVKEMKAVTNSRAIPLLSTPQSLLFVDAHLEPGDEKSFSFSFKLPRGLPASHRGKAIKIVYSLIVGIQGAPGAQQQISDMRQISVPFRVFPAVDVDGEIFGHDLMQPHVILKDLAKTRQIDDLEHDYTALQPTPTDLETSNTRFLEFIDTLLDRTRRRQSTSSITMEPFKPQSGGPVGSSQSQALRSINHAIMTSNLLGSGGGSDSSTSPNRFEIASGGKRIAVVTLDRPLHRLGETVTVVVDFSNTDVVCSSLRATLETNEKVVQGLAVRSAATIARVTRKVYASRAENVLSAQRAVFAPAIPVLVSPSFITSGVSLEWFVKLEFGTVRETDVDGNGIANGEQTGRGGPIGTNAGDQDANGQRERGAGVGDRSSIKPAVLEEIVDDERGLVEVAVESLECDTFEVNIPITVYGDVVNDGTASSDDIVGVPI